MSEYMEEELSVEGGYKMVHGDVYRRPKYPFLLSILMGLGLSLLCCSFLYALLPLPAIFFYPLGSLIFPISATRYEVYLKGTQKNKDKPNPMTKMIKKIILYALAFNLTACAILVVFTQAYPLWYYISAFGLGILLSMLSFFLTNYNTPSPYSGDPTRTNQIPRLIPAASFFMRSSLVWGFFAALLNVPSFYMLMVNFTGCNSALEYPLFASNFVITLLPFALWFTFLLVDSEDYTWWWKSYSLGFSYCSFSFVLLLLVWVTLYGVSSLSMQSWLKLMVCFIFLPLATGWISFAVADQLLQSIYSSIKLPVIYLYPLKPTPLSVQVILPFGAFFTFMKPVLDRHTMKWWVTAFPDGSLVNHPSKADNEKFWREERNKSNIKNNTIQTTNMHKFGSKKERQNLLNSIKKQDKGGEGTYLPFIVWEASFRHYQLSSKDTFYIVQKKRYKEFLEKMLVNEKGLSHEETNDFLEYWKEELGSKTNHIIFQFVEDKYLADFKLVVEPPPGLQICVFVLFKSLAQAEKRSLVNLDNNKTKEFWKRNEEKGLERKTREQFTVVEWGAMDLG